MRNHALLAALLLGLTYQSTFAAPGDAVFETCPAADDVGANVKCYPVHITSKTEIHPDGIPIIAYLFVPTDAPAEPLPAIVFAHGSGSMYSSGNHNKGLNSKQEQWVRQYTGERKIPTLHVSSFHSRYLLPNTAGDQRILDWENPPVGNVGGDDYRATSDMFGLNDVDDDLGVATAFDPEIDGWNDKNNSGGGVSEALERAYDADAAWDFLAGVRKGRFLTNSRNDDADEPTLGTPMSGEGFIHEIVTGGIVIDHERIFFSGTSHGGQTAMTAAHAGRALDAGNPMGDGGVGGRRFAAFFDYYGGCSVYGAYGGATYDPADPPEENSQWRPYAPFIMFHGEMDPIWEDDDTGTTRDRWENSHCIRRIQAAKADPDFDQFLEAIVYAGAHHSFDGAKRDDFDDENDTAGDSDFDEWAAKIHANYRMQLRMMDAIGRIVSQVRNSETAWTLADFGFSEANPYFSTYPLSPGLPPVLKDSQLSTFGLAASLGNLEGTAIFNFLAAFEDPLQVFVPGCANGVEPTLPANITYDANCQLSIALDAGQRTSVLGGTPLTFEIPIDTDAGRTFLPLKIQARTATTAELRKGAPAYFLPSNFQLEADISDGELNMDLAAFAWTEYRSPFDVQARYSKAVDPGGYSISNNRYLQAAGVPVDGLLRLGLRRDLHIKQFTATASTVIGVDFTQFVTGAVSVGLADGTDLDLPSPDFVTNYDELPAVSTQTPPTLQDLDDAWNPGATADGDGDGDGDRDGGDNTGGTGSGTGGDGGNSGGGGGGALFWLLPFTLLLRRR